MISRLPPTHFIGEKLPSKVKFQSALECVGVDLELRSKKFPSILDPEKCVEINWIDLSCKLTHRARQRARFSGFGPGPGENPEIKFNNGNKIWFNYVFLHFKLKVVWYPAISFETHSSRLQKWKLFFDFKEGGPNSTYSSIWVKKIRGQKKSGIPYF